MERTITKTILALCITCGASLAQPTVEPSFPSGAVAAQRLFEAVQSNNEEAIVGILGGPSELTTSNDPGQDKLDRDLFVRKYQEMHRMGREADGSLVLYIGSENWPFPVPLVNEKGAWHFDPDAGQKELLFRRIGGNELVAIATCREFAAAEKHYVAAPEDPVGSSPASLVARAAGGSVGGDPILISGYYFRLVLVQPADKRAAGGSALIAYPAEYSSSGVMTFVVTKNGTIYQKDLGADTSSLINAMRSFHRDSTWRPAGE
jgi:hypothetical protein